MSAKLFGISAGRLVFLSKKYANLAVEKEVEELNKRISNKQSNI